MASAASSEYPQAEYSIGVNTANGIQTQFTEANRDALIKGLNDALDSSDMLITSEQTQGVIQAYFQKKQAEDAANMEARQVENVIAEKSRR